MKRKFSSYLFLLIILLTIHLPGFSQKWKDLMKESNANFFEIQKSAHKYFKEYEKELKKNGNVNNGESEENESAMDDDYKRYMRWEWFWKTRVLPDGSFPDLNINLKAYLDAHASDASRSSGNAWVNFSQMTATGGYNGMGRVNDVAFDPTDINKFFVATPGGGVWKTTTAGTSYTPVADFIPQTRTGGVIVDKNNPNTIYISIGDYNYYLNFYNGMGVYKSTDGGATWNPTGLTNQLSAGLRIAEMAMSPTNSNVLIAATNNGLSRTTNGGANWTTVRSGSYSDVKFKPGDGNTIYAATSGGTPQVFKSTDGGTTWAQASNFTQTGTKLRLGVTPANVNMLAVESTNQKAFYVSTNSGGSFTLKSNYPDDEMFIISPNDANIIYSGSLQMYKSTDGGVNWTQMTNWSGTAGGRPEVHADFHNAKYSPVNTKLIYFCNDGGIYRYDESNNSWKDLSNGLIITQFYSLATAQTNANVVVGGAQDNGGRMRNTAGNWVATNGGDAMVQAADKTNANVLYSTYVNGELYRSTDGWASSTTISNNIPGGKPNGAWVMPYTLDPSNNNTIVAGYDDVYRSTNQGTNWTKISNSIAGGGTLTCIEVAPSNSAVIYTSRGNQLYKTTNTGGNWATYTVPGSEEITGIAIHPTNSNTLWVTKAGYTAGSKVFKSTDGGATWQNISGSLPNIPMNAIAYEENNNTDALYLGSDIGVYYRNNTLSDWTSFSTALPNTPVMDFAIYYPGKKIRIATYGRGMWETNLYSTAPITAAFTSSTQKTCTNTQVTYSDQSVSGATSWKWTFPGGTPATSTVQNPTVTYTSTGSYNVKLVVQNSTGKDSLTKTNYIVVDAAPNPPTTTGADRCGPGILNLSANGSGTLEWYDAATGGNMVTTGTNYSPSLNTTTTYYVDASTAPAPQKVGPVDTTFGSGINYTSTDVHGLLFNVISACRLKTVKVYAGSAGNRTVELLTGVGGTVLLSKVVNIPAGESRITLNFDLTPANQLFLKITGTVIDLKRTAGGASYPYTLAGLVSITETDVASSYPNYYYYFYDWEITVAGCSSNRIAVTGTINAVPPTPTITKNGSMLTSSSPTGNQWYFNGTIIPGATSQNYTPTADGNYTVVVTINSCSSNASTPFNVVSTGIAQSTDESSFSIYPNPVKDYLIIESGNLVLQKYTVTDVSGKLIMQNLNPSRNINTIDVHGLSDGIYFINLSGHDFNIHKKIIVNN